LQWLGKSWRIGDAYCPRVDKTERAMQEFLEICFDGPTTSQSVTEIATAVVRNAGIAALLTKCVTGAMKTWC